jgi:hypothetical protein
MITDEYKPLWLNNILGFFSNRIRVSHFIISLIVSGLPTLTFNILLICQRHQFMTVTSCLGYVFCTIWLGIGPFLIWQFDEASFDFIRELQQITQCPNDIIIGLKVWFNRFFRRLSLLPSVLLIGFGIFFWTSAAISIKTLGITGHRDPLFWFGLIIVIWGAMLGGIGFHGVISMIALIRRSSNLSLKLEPLHYDGVGGLGFIGQYIVLTTGIFASGALFVPLILHCAMPQGTTACLGYCILGTFSVFVLASFVYPVYMVHKNAIRTRSREIASITAHYRRLVTYIDNDVKVGASDKLIYEELARLSREHDNLRHLHLYPFNTGILSKVALSILFPFILKIVEKIIFKAL